MKRMTVKAVKAYYRDKRDLKASLKALKKLLGLYYQKRATDHCPLCQGTDPESCYPCAWRIARPDKGCLDHYMGYILVEPRALQGRIRQLKDWIAKHEEALNA